MIALSTISITVMETAEHSKGLRFPQPAALASDGHVTHSVP
jgi:hypothetical protein